MLAANQEEDKEVKKEIVILSNIDKDYTGFD